jgi:hypothetical protein
VDIYNLKQHVDVPTHIKGHTLDIVITPKKPCVECLCVTNIDLSHHFLIDFNASLMIESIKEQCKISYRSSNFDIMKFREDIKKASLHCHNQMIFVRKLCVIIQPLLVLLTNMPHL